ncbi:MAG: hypothetical protein O7J95_06930 [Planctomycetota bacterium]|nr:hypothetical protein [Planctomycetota bacterium]
MKKLLFVALLLNAALLVGRLWQEMPVNAQVPPVVTENGDVNGDGGRNLSDAVYLLNWLFRGGSAPAAIAQQGGGLTAEQEDQRGESQHGERRRGCGPSDRVDGGSGQVERRSWRHEYPRNAGSTSLRLSARARRRRR